MSAAPDCNCACPTPTITEIPGSPGAAGAAGTNGTNGLNAYTFLTSDLTLPAPLGTVTAFVVNASSFPIQSTIFISDGTTWGHFRVDSIASGNLSMGLTFLNYQNDSAAGTITFASSIGKVSPSGTQPPLSAALPTAVDYSLLTAAGAVDNLAVAAGVGKYKLVIPCTPVAGVLAGEVVTNYLIGHKFKIIDWAFVATVAIVGGSRVFNMEIDATDVGTVPSTVTLPATAIGGVVAGTAVAGANSGSAIQTFSIEVAAGGVSITAGSGFFVVTVQNMETADAFASLSDHVNDLITSLT